MVLDKESATLAVSLLAVIATQNDHLQDFAVRSRSGAQCHQYHCGRNRNGAGWSLVKTAWTQARVYEGWSEPDQNVKAVATSWSACSAYSNFKRCVSFLDQNPACC